MLTISKTAAKPKPLYRIMYSENSDHMGKTKLREPIDVGSAYRAGVNLVLRFDFDIGRGLCEGRLVLEPLATADPLMG